MADEAHGDVEVQTIRDGPRDHFLLRHYRRDGAVAESLRITRSPQGVIFDCRPSGCIALYGRLADDVQRWLTDGR